MSKCISFGPGNKFYRYILLASISYFLYNSLYGIQYNSSFKEIKIFSTNIQKNLSKHQFIHKTFNCFGIFLISLFIYKNKSKDLDINLETKTVKHNEIFYSKKLFFLIFFIIFLLLTVELFITCYTVVLKDLDFWMLELLIINYIFNKMFHTQTYNHQKLAICLNLICSILKIITIYLSNIHNVKNKIAIIYIKYKWLIPVGIISYLILITIHSYSISKIKWFFDKNYVSVSLLLVFYGAIGTIFYLLVSLISNFIECSTILKNYICLIHDSHSYVENFSIYFKNFKKEIGYEIIIILFGIIIFYFYNFYSFLIIKTLSPLHIIFLTPIYFALKKIFLPIFTLINNGTYFSDSHMENIYAKYILDFSGDIITNFSFIIYLEIIELNCCELKYNLRRTIIERSESEVSTENRKTKFIFMENGDIEEKDTYSNNSFSEDNDEI